MNAWRLDVIEVDPMIEKSRDFKRVAMFLQREEDATVADGLEIARSGVQNFSVVIPFRIEQSTYREFILREQLFNGIPNRGAGFGDFVQGHIKVEDALAAAGGARYEFD